jgi:NADH-quinone oxidoreductase subunit M
MILVWLIVIPLVAGVVGWLCGRKDTSWPRWIAVGALSAESVMCLSIWAQYADRTTSGNQDQWLLQFHRAWIPELGIGFSLSLDGLSLILVTLTAFLGLVSVVCSWTEITERVGFFHFNVLATLSGIIGVFLATDLILFYFFWELMLVPMYFLIGIWGHENRIYAAIKFFIFTQAGGLLMLAAILALYFVHGDASGVYSFNYFDLLSHSSGNVSMWIMLGFFVAFAIKLPMVPFHTWLPDAHTEAPTAGSVILAGLLLKTGGYGLIRFVFPLFPDAALEFAPWAMLLGVVGILYGAVLAFAQTDLKRLVAYTSISHLGFVLVGVFTATQLAFQGAVMQMVCHGISTGALFVLVGMLQERTHTRDMGNMGGLWATAPRMGAMAMVFALASLGLPGLGNFVGEFLVLVGTYQVAPRLAVPAAVGLVLAAVYSLWLMRRVFFGPAKEDLAVSDLSLREAGLLAAMAAFIVVLGVHPQPVFTAAAPVFKTTAVATLTAPRQHSHWSGKGDPGQHSEIASQSRWGRAQANRSVRDANARERVSARNPSEVRP